MESPHSPSNHPYRQLAINVGLSFIIMAVIMFARVDIFENVFVNLNLIYMAGLMVTPMVIIMVLTMPAMFDDSSKNKALIGGSLGLMVFLWLAIRNQWLIDDQQFLRSMIPHHAGAFLVCEQADLSDPEVQQLCREIIEAQEREIRLMKKILTDQNN